MKHSHGLIVLILAIVLATGCDWDGLRESPRPNQMPTVRITGGAVNGTDASYDVEFFWFGSDPDGAVDGGGNSFVVGTFFSQQI